MTTHFNYADPLIFDSDAEMGENVKTIRHAIEQTALRVAHDTFLDMVQRIDEIISIEDASDIKTETLLTALVFLRVHIIRSISSVSSGHEEPPIPSILDALDSLNRFERQLIPNAKRVLGPLGNTSHSAEPPAKKA